MNDPFAEPRDNLTDSERARRGRYADEYWRELVLVGKHVAGESHFWFRSDRDKQAFASIWCALGWEVR